MKRMVVRDGRCACHSRNGRDGQSIVEAQAEQQPVRNIQAGDGGFECDRELERPNGGVCAVAVGRGDTGDVRVDA
jgi:hypothetical protein